MQVRFIFGGQVGRLMPDGTTQPFEVGIGDIHPCKEIVYDDETCEWADIHFNDGSVIEGIAGECFERMGSEVSYANKANQILPSGLISLNKDSFCIDDLPTFTSILF